VKTENLRYPPLRILSLPAKDFGGNPYSKYFSESLERAGLALVNIHAAEAKYFEFDVLHLHWPEFYVTERSLYKAVILAPAVLVYMTVTKLLRKKIVWTVHDVIPVKPRHAGLLRLYLSCVRVLVDAFVFMSPSSEAEFIGLFPRAKKKISWHVPHGPYPVSATSSQRRAELREQLSGGANCLLVGFVGDIKPYKNPEALAYLPREDTIGRKVKIVVAGAVDSTFDTRQIEGALSRIQPAHLVRIRERLSDQYLADIIRAVDVVLLPYLRGSNSGLGMFVLSCGQRLLCSALPMFRDLASRPGPPWVYVFDYQAKDLSAELEAALSRFQSDVVDTDAKSRLQAFLDDCSFDHGARQLRQLYERLTLPQRQSDA
jgi:glycosyltransferase involved in cell wall biosynthesis